MDNVNAAYSQAATVASQYNPSQATVNSAATALKNAIKSPQNPPVGTVKIKTAKNAKGKKISLLMYILAILFVLKYVLI